MFAPVRPHRARRRGAALVDVHASTEARRGDATSLALRIFPRRSTREQRCARVAVT
jgi:hypothetical protein